MDAISLVAVILLCLGMCLQGKCQGNGMEDHDAEVRLKEELLTNYKKNVFPPHTPGSPVVVRFGRPIMSVTELDAKTQTLTTELWLRMTWPDSRLAWKPEAYNNLKRFQLEDHQVWQPQVILLNSAKFSAIDEKAMSFVTVHSNGSVRWGPPATVHTHCEVDLKYYPYDIHECNYKFGSYAHNNTHIDVDLESNDTEKAVFMGRNIGGEWKVLKTSAVKSTNIFPCCEGAFPDITYYLTLQRRSPFYGVAIVCPILVTMFFIFTSLWMSPIAVHRIILNLVAFLTLVSILGNFTIRLPAVGSSVPLIMVLGAILTFLSGTNTVTTMWYIHFINSKGQKSIPNWTTTLLKSRVAKVLLISSPPPFEQFNNAEAPAQLPPVTATSSQLQWIAVFQFIDRVAFIIYAIITITVMACAL